MIMSFISIYDSFCKIMMDEFLIVMVYHVFAL